MRVRGAMKNAKIMLVGVAAVNANNVDNKLSLFILCFSSSPSTACALHLQPAKMSSSSSSSFPQVNAAC